MIDTQSKTDANTSIGVILAAGMGKRMKSDTPKVAHTILGRPLILWAADSLINANISNIVFVISPGQPCVENIINNEKFPAHVKVCIAYQDIAQGTGHAAKCALPSINKLLAQMPNNPQQCNIIIGFGDTPAMQAHSFAKYLQYHKNSNNSFTVLAFNASNPFGYGRVVTDQNNAFVEIREHKDCDLTQQKINLCNSGFLCAKLNDFMSYLPKITNNNKAKEFYLTDLPSLAAADKLQVGVYSDISQAELEGVNSQQQLAEIAAYMQENIITHWLNEGVQFLNPKQVYLEKSVSFGNNVIVEPFVFLAGNTNIPNNCRVSAFSKIINNKNISGE